MSAGQTKFPKNPVPARQVHQRTAIVGKNGLTVDAQATLEPGSVLVSGSSAYTYTQPTVTMPGVDFSNLLTIIQTAKHTGVLLLTDASNNSYFIDFDSIDNTAKTLDIYIDAELTSSPVSIDNTGSWVLSEAELVNRLQTTTTAVIDNVEFRDVSINVDLDGSTVNIKDDDGDQLEIEGDGAINAYIRSRLIDVPHDDIEILAKNADGDPLEIAVRFEGQLVRTLNLTYDSDGDLQRVQRT
jgi:hypothetical protein